MIHTSKTPHSSHSVELSKCLLPQHRINAVRFFSTNPVNLSKLRERCRAIKHMVSTKREASIYRFFPFVLKCSHPLSFYTIAPYLVPSVLSVASCSSKLCVSNLKRGILRPQAQTEALLHYSVPFSRNWILHGSYRPLYCRSFFTIIWNQAVPPLRYSIRGSSE